MNDILYHPNFIKLIRNYPLMLNAKNPKHLLVFRRMIEWSMTKGFWAGTMAEES